MCSRGACMRLPGAEARSAQAHRALAARTELPRGEGAEYDIYPRDLKEPYESAPPPGRRAALSVDRRDARGPRRRAIGNTRAISNSSARRSGCSVSIDRSMGPPQWSDLGGYIQTVMLLARGHGLHTCAQEAWTHWHKTVSVLPRASPRTTSLFCGMALGHADPDAADQQMARPARAARRFCVV